MQLKVFFEISGKKCINWNSYLNRKNVRLVGTPNLFTKKTATQLEKKAKMDTLNA